LADVRPADAKTRRLRLLQAALLEQRVDFMDERRLATILPTLAAGGASIAFLSSSRLIRAEAPGLFGREGHG
jgi:hypothetical protein